MVKTMAQALTERGIVIGEKRGEERGEKRGEERGEKREARRIILRLGARRFGEPDAATTAAIEAIDDHERLQELGLRLLEVESWSELLDGVR